MDELLHHCLRELAFDGDLGCDVSRLSDFIKDFYTHSSLNQQVDDAFCAFVWSLIVQQPTVLVGTIPADVTSEVWIAPQISAKRKASARGEEHPEVAPPALNLVPDAKLRALAELQREHGSSLRIAGDRDSIYAAITGTHIRFPKMSPMVYSALQVITRGRVDGVTVVELGQRTKYDQKTCFYLVKQLTDLNLVVKVRRGGVGTHFVIHRYFFERSPHWKAIRDEELQAELNAKNAQSAEGLAAAEGQEEEEIANVASLGFTPIDSRHLSSLPLVRGRVVKLLKASTNNMHVSNNMIVTLGFARPTKTDRRFFHRRIQELIQQGVVEKVLVPSRRKKSKVATVLCLRLVNENGGGDGDGDGDGAVVVPPIAGGDHEQIEDESAQGGFKMNVTLHKQISDLLEEAGTTGMTLTELSTALCNFDRRTIELILARAERFQPPSHLSDLGVAALLETSGRERRHRYFTISAYRILVERENLDKSSAGYGDVDLDNIGGFMHVDPGQFYQDDEELHRYQDEFKDDDLVKAEKVGKKSGTGMKVAKKKVQVADADVEDDGNRAQASSRRGKRKAIDSSVDQLEPIDARPSKRLKTQNAASRGADDAQASVPPSEPSIPKKRGRPRKSVDASADAPPKKRGRPPKANVTLNEDNVGKGAEGESDQGEVSPPKKRGRKLDNPPTHASGVNDGTNGKDGGGDGLRRSTRKAVNALSSKETPAREDDVEMIGELQGPTIKQVGADMHAPGPSSTQVPAEDANLSQTELPGATMQILDPSLADTILLIKVPEQSISNQTLRPSTPSTSQSQRANLPSSKSTAQPRPKVNVSNLRRENELLRVVESLGGIVNTQTKELYDAHLALLDTLAKANEPASSPPGIKADKRTVTATFNALESRGKVKQLTTTVPVYIGNSRQTVIVYLPHISDAQLSAFLADLAQGIGPPNVPQLSGRIMEDVSDYGHDKTLLIRKPEPVRELEKAGIHGPDRWNKDVERAEQLFSQDESFVREILLTERSTLCQAYHTIIAKCLRAREIHLICLRAFEMLHPSLQIVSHQHKIIHLTFLSLELPLGQYTQLVSPLSHSEELRQFMSHEAGLNTVVKDLPENIRTILQVGKSRANSKLLECLELLRGLGLVSPLVASDSDTPLLTCDAKHNHPTAFEAASLEGWSPQASLSAPIFWKFNNAAPVYYWAISETDPPFLQDVDVSSVQLAIDYWAFLQSTCLDRSMQVPSQTVSHLESPKPSLASARTFRRRVSWNSRYIFSWHQTQYMKRFYSVASGTTPLEAEDRDAQIERISWVISAPPDAVRDYYANIQNRLAREADKARKRRKHQELQRQAQEDANVQASLKKKAEEAHMQREMEWGQLLERVHPEPLPKAASNRIKQIRGRFLQSVAIQDNEKWEAEIVNTIREAEMLSAKVLKPRAKAKATAVTPVGSISAPEPSQNNLSECITATTAPPIAMNPPERSVIELIADQGPPLIQAKKQPKKKQKQKGEVDENDNKPRIVNRRHRFAWNREYEELARDAAAIIKARCRDAIRLDWGAFEQVFPAVPRNTVRQRVAHLREATGGEAYLNRLEDSWYDLWRQHRGSDLLPDDDPRSPTNFDLVKHIEFLRRHIDKNALRVGYMPAQKVVQPAIPNKVSDLFEQFDVVESQPNAPSWDSVWNAIVEEVREKGMLSLPFTNQLDTLPLQDESADEQMCLAQSALKMVLGTPHEVYDSEVASTLLSSMGEDIVPLAAQNLLGRGVLSKLVRDPQKSQPGRQLKISEVNQNALNGVISQDTFQDAASLEELSAQEDVGWREWPLLATDGDLATLVQLVSENKIELVIDTSHPQACRPALDWNSKKADDDQIETTINFRFPSPTDQVSSSTESVEPAEPATASIDIDKDSSVIHGVAVDGSPACCRKNALGTIVNCSGCLDELWKIHSARLSAEELSTAQLILWSVGQAGARGLSKQDLIVTTEKTLEELTPVLTKMTRESFLHWVGYNHTLLVSAAHAGSWTVLLSESPSIRVFPRRWLDIHGKKVIDVWEAALRAVIGAIVFRPGISQCELRWRLKSLYDKQEVMELLKMLLEEDFIKNRFVSTTRSSVSGYVDPLTIVTLDEQEERRVFWFLNEAKHWYLI
ncbi:hypothetical protein F5878DRAFT_328184 [Lentinula raphanica]|uniref:Transcription factor tau subunit sfc3/Tfc3 C-terminal domain-containing protein n=1 Tax=Lentinula raphanica TaxID=153919 RepID=A0AA38P2F8_9AGAR|nr:hypothetical protein F5878DRAFT_328184 [Lentinula raphanica]